jgi:hypothetical protein
MRTTGLRNFIRLSSVLRIAQNLLKLFRFTEADAWAILSVYGFHAPEVGRPQNNRPNERAETDGSLGPVSHRNWIGEPPGRAMPI